MFGTQTKLVPGITDGGRGLFAVRDIPANHVIHRYYGRVMSKPDLLKLYSKDGRSKMTDGFPYDISLPNGRVVTAACDRDAASHANSASVGEPSQGTNSTTEKNAEIRVKFVGRMDPKEIKPHDVVTFSGTGRLPKGGRRYDTYNHVLHHAYVVDTGDDTVTVRTIVNSKMPDKTEDQTADEWFTERGQSAVDLVNGMVVDLENPVVDGVRFGRPIVKRRDEVNLNKYQAMIVSIKNIQKDDEILVNYGDGYFKDINYEYEHKRVGKRASKQFDCMKPGWC